MKIGKVVVDFDKLSKQYPFTAIHVVDILSEKQNVSYDVLEEDNNYYDEAEKEVRVRFSYEESDGKKDSFTLLLHEKYLSFD